MFSFLVQEISFVYHAISMFCGKMFICVCLQTSVVSKGRGRVALEADDDDDDEAQLMRGAGGVE